MIPETLKIGLKSEMSFGKFPKNRILVKMEENVIKKSDYSHSSEEVGEKWKFLIGRLTRGFFIYVKFHQVKEV